MGEAFRDSFFMVQSRHHELNSTFIFGRITVGMLQKPFNGEGLSN